MDGLDGRCHVHLLLQPTCMDVGEGGAGSKLDSSGTRLTWHDISAPSWILHGHVEVHENMIQRLQSNELVIKLCTILGSSFGLN